MKRKNVMGVLRVAASVVVLAILIPRVQLSSLLPDLRAHTLAWLIGAVVLTFGAVVLSAVRWQRVLAALGLSAGIVTLTRHDLASLFVGNVLPSTVGGDVLRVSRLAATNGESPRTFASVALERLTGWIVLPVLTLSALAINPGLRRVAPTAASLATTVAVGTLVLLGVLLVAASSPRVGGRLASNEGWRRFTGAVHLGLDRFRRSPGLAVEVLTAAFAYQLAVMLTAFLAAHALGLRVGWTAILAFFPAVAIIQVIPVTLGGLGTREGALVFFLHDLNVSSADAIALGLLFYGINLIVSLAGAPAFAVGSRRTQTVRV